MAEQNQTGDTAVVAQGAQPAPTQITTPAPDAVVTPAPTVPAPTTLPVESSDRTREQFEKLLESNRILTELALRNQTAVAQPVQQPVVPEPNLADFTRVNPITGEEYIDREKLTKVLADSRDTALKSQEIARQAADDARRVAEEANRREIERQEKETFSTFPELNRKDKNFNEKFEKKVRGVLLDSYVNTMAYGGRPLSFLEAAKFVQENVSAGVETPVKVSAEAQPATAPTAQELKEQANVSVPSQPQQVLPSANAEEMQRLSLRTRLGDDSALAERLKYTEHISPEGAETT